MDVGEQALIRGLATASPCVRPEASRSGTRASAVAGHTMTRGNSSAAASPPPMRSRVGCPERVTVGYAGLTSRPMAQTKPASSRAMAVTATVSLLPRAASAR